MNIAKWFNEDAGSTKSCCALLQPVTEFGCQGLELDMPIVCWGDDFYRSNGAWEARKKRTAYLYRDPFQLRLNSYRVLLTRGRDGLIV